MNLYAHFCEFGLSNCYILGEKNEAVIIDIGSMDGSILKTIEDNNYHLAGVFFTHGHVAHVHGINTLRRIYNPEIYGISPFIQGQKTFPVRDGDSLSIGPFKIEVIAVPGHSPDSAIFKIGRMLFSGDALSAGRLGSAPSIYAESNQMNALRGKILSLPGDYSVFPGHGPPTSLEAERRYNASITAYEDFKTRRVRFRPKLQKWFSFN